jgi:hypothetical protein
MELTINEYYAEFRENYNLTAEGGNDFTQAAFVEEFAKELI